MAIKGIDHIAIRVRDIEEGIANYTKMGFELTKQLETPGIGKQAIFRFADGTFIELVAPLGADSAVGRALESRGEGVHSVVITTDDFDADVAAMAESGANVLPAGELAGNVFLHPKSSNGVLLQIQKAKS